MSLRLKDVGEDALIARVLAGCGSSGLLVGPGDDCAVVDDGGDRLRLLKTDAIVEGVHFAADAEADRVGWKAVARVLSDFAAMGGRPERLLVTLALPGECEVAWVEALYRGMARCMEAHGGVLAGGETTAVPDGSAAVISVSGEGSVARDLWVGRAGGKPGHLLAVTGRLGGSITGRHLDFPPRLAEGAWLAAGGASAMMDLSDGLAKDLPRLASASGCGIEIDRGSIPKAEGVDVAQALGDGEDYELLFAIPEARWRNLVEARPVGCVEVSRIGRLTADPGQTLVGGWEHFAKSESRKGDS